MKLAEILTIAGQPGLHRFIGQNKGGVIVESLSDARRFLVSSTSKVSALSDIAIFTYSEDLPLAEVFQLIYTATEGKEIENAKKLTNDELKAKMKEFVAEYDVDRVHVSDMKKLFTWYNILVGAGTTSFVDTSDEESKLEVKPKVAAPKAKAQNTKTQANTKSKSASKVRTIKAS